MREALIIKAASQLPGRSWDVRHAAKLPPRKHIIMADPAAFTVQYAINPHMRRSDGSLQQIEKKRAREQWEELRRTYQELGYKVDVIEAQPDQPDLVFTANQAFPYPDPADPQHLCFIPARMASEERAGEVAVVANRLTQRGMRSTPLHASVQGTFEAGGDVLWMGDRRALVGGIGPRTSEASLRSVADLVGCPLLAIELSDPDFFHLDTCLCFIDAETALWVPQAFRPASQQLLESAIPELVAIDDLEARRGLAANAHCPDGHRVLIAPGNPQTTRQLTELGKDVIEVDVTEFHKSGGSVFCMKLQTW